MVLQFEVHCKKLDIPDYSQKCFSYVLPLWIYIIGLGFQIAQNHIVIDRTLILIAIFNILKSVLSTKDNVNF